MQNLEVEQMTPLVSVISNTSTSITVKEWIELLSLKLIYLQTPCPPENEGKENEIRNKLLVKIVDRQTS